MGLNDLIKILQDHPDLQQFSGDVHLAPCYEKLWKTSAAHFLYGQLGAFIMICWCCVLSGRGTGTLYQNANMISSLKPSKAQNNVCLSSILIATLNVQHSFPLVAPSECA